MLHFVRHRIQAHLSVVRVFRVPKEFGQEAEAGEGQTVTLRTSEELKFPGKVMFASHEKLLFLVGSSFYRTRKLLKLLIPVSDNIT